VCVCEGGRHGESQTETGLSHGVGGMAVLAGVTVLVDNKAMLSVLGTEMDYVENEETLSAEFVFNNPNVKSLCGCRESFHV
jgi:iron-sulfur cluster assembly accessory protein